MEDEITPFCSLLRQMMRDADKTTQQVAYLGGLDEAYVRRLRAGYKSNPSMETILRLFIGIVFDASLAKKHRMMVFGLTDLAEAAALTAAQFVATQ